MIDMIEDSKNLAIQVLQQKISELQQQGETQIAELHLAITQLRGPCEKPIEPVCNYPSVRVGQYQGMSRKSALQAYLNERAGDVLVTKLPRTCSRVARLWAKTRSVIDVIYAPP